MSENTPLSDEERSELEKLRAEKTAREEAQAAARERAELERLKAEKAANEKDAAERQRIVQAREKGRQLMEPDDEDLRMPKGQKIVIAVVVVVAAVWLLAMALG
ncbi:MAG: hypothetical protein LKI31_05735 [Olsenella sp.]|jgi:hypothetical protein|nr:hypothetical protein [Olsenella sp.]